MKYRVRVAIIFATFASFVMISLIFASLVSTNTLLSEQISNQITLSAQLVGSRVAEEIIHHDVEAGNETAEAMLQQPQIRAVWIRDASGKLLASAGETERRVALPRIVGRGNFDTLRGARIESDGAALIVWPIADGETVYGEVVIAPNFDAITAPLYTQFVHQFLLGIAGAVVIASGAWLVSGAMVEGIVELERGAARIADGDFQYRVDIAGQDEIARTALTVNRMADALLAEKAELERQARTDQLTGLLNRSGLAAGFADLSRSASAVSALHIGLDRFKMVNDTRGHSAGDVVLQTVARRLRLTTPPDALLARIGGDEFALVLPEEEPGDRSIALAEACIEAARRPVEYRGMKLTVGASAGIAHRPAGPGSLHAERLLSNADIALHQAKSSGRNRVALFDAAARTTLEAEAELEAEVAAGLERREFIPFLQAQVDGRDGTVIGAEILARWMHPSYGLLLPGQFLARLNNPDLVERITYAVRGAALDWFGADAQGRPPMLSLNLSAAELARIDCAADLHWELVQRGIPPERVVIEVLEDVVIREGDTEIERTLAALRISGHPLEFDDFGTGNSGLTNLVRLSAEQIKIDRSFVQGIDADRSRQAIVQAMVGIGRALGLRVLAEGVETEAERAMLLSLGCQRMQGFLFARPMPQRDFETWVKAHIAAA